MSAVDWRDALVSPDGTHHLLGGAPLYTARFDEVLKFHAPGLAPARDTSGMYHIDTSANPAYARRFRRTFGFYEGFAAVEDAEGWHHVGPDGEPAYAARWTWCGNFQERRCPARDGDGRYVHIRPDGAALYAVRWRYAGDFRDGIAVVQAEDGRSTHIDTSGCITHGRWYLDLDVFHKGFARARDERGWMHIDARGEPVYRRRFAMVEPFYNGQARVERDDGGLEIIDERGGMLVALRGARRDPLHAVSAELVSFWRCETIFAAVDLGLFERLPLADPPDEATLRLLYALGELGLVTLSSGRWEATSQGAVLRTDHPRSLAAAARYWAGDGRRPWRHLQAALQNPAWRPPDPFAEVATDPYRVAAFHAALSPYAEHDYAALPAAIDGGHATLLDAGGGTGALARAVLRSRPGMTATVLDRPEVARLGERPEDLAGRLTFVAGDLFAPWPVSADAVVLARVLHDWSDDQCVEILRHARSAIRPGGRLYVVEIAREPEGFGAALLSLHLLVSTGGKERTRAQFEPLFALAGLRLREVRQIPSISSVFVVEVA